MTSGIRVGTPCVTTQGMGPPEMKEIATMVAQVVRDPGRGRRTSGWGTDSALIRSIAARINALVLWSFSGHMRPDHPGN